MRHKPDLLWFGVLLLFLYACSDLIDRDVAGLSNREIAIAYEDIDNLVDEVAELSRAPVVIDAAQKRRIGASLHQAKKLVDQARDEVKGGAVGSDAYDEARAIIDDVSIEVADALQAKEFET